MFEPLSIDGLIRVRPKRHTDSRGFFSETYVAARFDAGGVSADFIQDNEARSAGCGVIRGFHFQAPPAAQAKLVRCVTGAIFDVVVDIRRGSPTYGKHLSIELSAENGEQLFIPAGFAHAYCTLTDETLVQYKVDAPYVPETEQGIAWNDHTLNIAWPVNVSDALVSEKDRTLPSFAALETPFAINA